MLKTTDLSAKQEHDSIIVGHGNLTSRIDVVPPTHRESENFPIGVVVRVRTDLREKLGAIFAEKPEMTAAMNGLASLGALTVESGSGRIFVGSRLSIYEDAENLLKLHVGLIVSAAVEATDSLLGATRRTFVGEVGKREESAWSADDMEEVCKFLSPHCLCGTGGPKFTAGTGASGNADNRRAASPDRKTWPAESFLLERLAQALGLVYRFYNASLIPASAGARARNLSVQRNGPRPKTLRNRHAMTYLRKRTRSTNVRKLTLP